jgi:hypothetical protein
VETTLIPTNEPDHECNFCGILLASSPEVVSVHKAVRRKHAAIEGSPASWHIRRTTVDCCGNCWRTIGKDVLK